MKKLKALVAACLAVTLLAGCGGSTTNGKTYTFSSELDIKNLDTSDADDGMSFNAMHACIDGLMGLDKDGKITPAIAEKHDVSEDGKIHTFTLRDAKWSNGDAVTANDFVYAWKRIIQKSGNYAYMLGSDGAAVKGADELMAKQSTLKEGQSLSDDDMKTLGVEAKDDKTLVVTTTRKIPYFEELMTFPCYYPINQKFCEEKGDQYAKSADNVLANGAFIMKTWEPGSKATFEKNPNYWNAEAVKIDNLIMNLVQKPEVAATSYDNGETDLAPITSDIIDKYKSNDGFRNLSGGYLFYLSLNFKNENLANANVRKALALAVNRQDFVDNKLKDGSKVADGFVPSGLSMGPDGKDFRETNGKFTKYDTKAAQEALDKGLKELKKDSITLRIVYGTDESPMDQLATYLQNAFSKLKGLKIEMVATTKQDRIYNKMANGDYDVACTRWGPDYGDPTTYLNLLITGNSNNYGKYSSVAYDENMSKAQAENDMMKRWTYLQQAEKVAMDDVAYIPVFEKGNAVLVNPEVKGLVDKAVGVPYTFNYVEK